MSDKNHRKKLIGLPFKHFAIYLTWIKQQFFILDQVTSKIIFSNVVKVVRSKVLRVFYFIVWNGKLDIRRNI